MKVVEFFHTLWSKDITKLAVGMMLGWVIGKFIVKFILKRWGWIE